MGQAAELGQVGGLVALQINRVRGVQLNGLRGQDSAFVAIFELNLLLGFGAGILDQEAKLGVPDANLVSVSEVSPRDGFAIHVCAIRAAVIDDEKPVVLTFDAAMKRGHHCVVDHWNAVGALTANRCACST
jgi:hypothetical protein